MQKSIIFVTLTGYIDVKEGHPSLTSGEEKPLPLILHILQIRGYFGGPGMGMKSVPIEDTEATSPFVRSTTFSLPVGKPWYEDRVTVLVRSPVGLTHSKDL